MQWRIRKFIFLLKSKIKNQYRSYITLFGMKTVKCIYILTTLCTSFPCSFSKCFFAYLHITNKKVLWARHVRSTQPLNWAKFGGRLSITLGSSCFYFISEVPLLRLALDTVNFVAQKLMGSVSASANLFLPTNLIPIGENVPFFVSKKVSYK